MEYTGYTRIKLSDEHLANFYNNKDILTKDFNENQYIVITNAGDEVIDKYIVRKGKLEKVNYSVIHSALMGKIKPRNVEQELAFHLLQDPQTKIKVLTGRYGSGKTMAMLAQALELLNKDKFDRIVYVRNNIGVRDTNELGSLPGSEVDKLYPYLMPLADHIGSKEMLDDYILSGKIEPIHLGFLRGRDLRNSLIYCTEAQNLSVDHMKLLIGRVGEGSELWLDGDFRAQVDKNVFERSNGLKTTIERLKNNKNFGYVHLVKSERSEVAALADLLDD